MPAKKNLIGQTFGWLTVIKEAEPLILASGKSRTQCVCLCKCGKETIVSSQSLIQGTTISCGCFGAIARTEGKRKAVENKMLDKHFGRWHVDSYAGQKYLPSGQTRSLWNCTCECGTRRTLTTNQLNEGSLSCGCLRSELASARETINLIGMRFDSLVVLERIGSKHYGKQKLSMPLWKCKCDCGKECIATSRALIEGRKKSCGCQRRLNLEGLRFGLLVVIKYDETKKKWLCKCDCGNLTYKAAGHLRAGSAISCGCQAMSKNEIIINDYLMNKGVKFANQYSFKKLKGPNGGQLRFDFAILNEDNFPVALIEYQGQQHFEEIEGYEYFGKTARDITDFIKRLFCDQTHIDLYTISYNQNVIEECDKILSQIKFAHANAVPSSKEKV